MELRDLPTILKDAIQVLKESGKLDELFRRKVVAVTAGSGFIASHIV